MDNCKTCNIRYLAEDGTLFKTQEECQKYEDIPHMWIAENRGDIEIFVTKEQAEAWVNEERLISKGFRATIRRKDIKVGLKFESEEITRKVYKENCKIIYNFWKNLKFKYRFNKKLALKENT